MLFALPNLISKTVVECTPWEFRKVPPPEVTGADGKSARSSWASNPKLEWEVYSAFEGIDPGQRIVEAKAGNEGNPPLKCHALIADIDAPITDAELEAALARSRHRPNYFERTLSGNVRLIWLLEAPVSFPNYVFAKEWLALVLAETKIDHIAGGFDKPAFLEPNRYYTNAGVWFTIDPDVRIPFALANGWIVKTAEKHLWKKNQGSVEIPLPEIFKELLKKWPLLEWPGAEFVEGSQGPTFWVEGSSSPKSAIVKTTGLFTFSSSAPKPFYSWADLVGAKFVDDYTSTMMGKAVEGIYFDGSSYYRKNGFGQWRPFSKEDIGAHLRVDRGLSPQKQGSAPSEVERALAFVQNWAGVDGAAPFVFQPPGVLHRSGATFLNTHTRKVIPPAAEKAVWGPDGNLPWLSAYLGQLLDPVEQLDFFLSWLSRYYSGAHTNNLECGQNVFLLGPAGVGKTLLSQGILNRLMGGSADAEDYLLGASGFNSQLFDVALWTIDDNSANVDAATHKKFSAMTKKMAANTTFAYHAKFRIPCSVDWLGRVLVTANDDEESARIVPDLSMSLLDKLMLFKTTRTPIEFPARQALLGILDRELPYLARFLLDYSIPQHCRGSARFGVKAYHEPSLLETAEQSSRSAGFHEIVDDWAQTFFAEKTDLECWEGTAFQFIKVLHNGDMAASAALRSLTPETVSRQLVSLKSKGFRVENHSDRNTRVWKIFRPTKGQPRSPHPIGTKFRK